MHVKAGGFGVLEGVSLGVSWVGRRIRTVLHHLVRFFKQGQGHPGWDTHIISVGIHMKDMGYVCMKDIGLGEDLVGHPRELAAGAVHVEGKTCFVPKNQPPARDSRNPRFHGEESAYVGISKRTEEKCGGEPCTLKGRPVPS